MDICQEIDNFLEDKTLWVVTLSNGLTVYQDDDRPGLKERCAWIRLALYCQKQHVHIINMKLKFRSHEETVYGQAEGYFFRQAASGVWGSPKTYCYYIAGYLKNGIIYTKQWKIPELLVVDEGQRDPAKAGESLIRI